MASNGPAFEHLVEHSERLFEAVLPQEQDPVGERREAVRRAELQRQTVRRRGLAYLPPGHEHRTLATVGLTQAGIELDRALRVPCAPVDEGLGRDRRGRVRLSQRVRDAGMRLRVVWIELGRRPEVVHRFERRSNAEPTQPLQSQEVLVVCHRVLRIGHRHPLGVRLEQRHAERPGDLLRDLGLDREDVVELAIVALGPHVVAVRDVDQLRGNPDAGPLLRHAALEQRADAELLTHIDDVDVPVLEGEARRARGDLEPPQLGERVEDLLGEAIREVLVIGICAQVHERQNRDRGLHRVGLEEDCFGTTTCVGTPEPPCPDGQYDKESLRPGLPAGRAVARLGPWRPQCRSAL